MGKKSRREKTQSLPSTTAGMKSIPLDAEATNLLKEQLTRFREKFGRDPEPNDPVFFNPDASTPEPITPAQDEAVDREIIEALVEAGIGPAFIYAYKKTGRIVTEQNRHLLTDDDLDEWNDALDEYARLSESQRG